MPTTEPNPPAGAPARPLGVFERFFDGDEEADGFREWCERNDVYVLTVNAFPYGRFHGVAVKERVYDPDWRDPARVDYTKAVADRLGEWLPTDAPGSISTVPIRRRRVQ